MNRIPCTPEDSRCGGCESDLYVLTDVNNDMSTCEERFILAPLTLRIADIDLSTRTNKIKLQTGVREMIRELSDEMQINTRNFYEIDTDKVLLVGIACMFSLFLSPVCE